MGGATMSWSGNGETGLDQPIPVAGSQLFMAANISLTVTTTGQGLELYRAHINLGDPGKFGEGPVH